jgi:hypothetical protein
MWVLTPHGFYSAVESKRDPDVIVVRARVRDDLVKLKRLIPGLRIIDAEGTDYAFRAYVSRDHWVDALCAMGDAIDYRNFKDEVKARQGYERAGVYGRVWTALLNLQPEHLDPWRVRERRRKRRRRRELPGAKLAAALAKASGR